jgi:tripeptidyl-peptidase-1
MDRVDVEFMKLGLRGVSVVVPSGDSGVWGRTGVLNGETFHPDYPASSPYVTTVGGTRT